jgi:UDP-N-acetylmuramate dehydrogenase
LTVLNKSGTQQKYQAEFFPAMNETQKLVQEKLVPHLRSVCLFDVVMSEHTTIRIGGAADCFIPLASFEDVRSILAFAHEHHVPYFVMGKGSNLLVSDRGIRGIVVQIDEGLDRYEVADESIRAEAGLSLWRLAQIACEHGLSGLEFACGIPGNVGGAVYMNAGAYGGEMKDVVESVRLIDENGEEITSARDEMDFSYRRSILQQRSMTVREISVRLQRGDRRTIEEKMQELAAQRAQRQPLDLPSAGSTFRRPPGNYAGALIAKSGLQGHRIGGARVSPKHAGFIVNAGGATCGDVLKLMEHIRTEVYRQFGVLLEPEIKIVGEQ